MLRFWPLLCLIAALPIYSAPPKVTPLSARPGDTFTLVVTSDGCPPTSDLSQLNQFDKSSILVSGSDITIKDDPKPTDCSVTATATIAAKPVNREQTITILQKPDPNAPSAPRKVLGTFKFEIVDIPAGPIPPGLNPQVDAMWDIMSEQNCSDQFGDRLARRYFCIDVLLGNNSGYPLILAGVGFLRHDLTTDYREPTSSYLTARSVIQREQVVSGRNITLRILQASGVVIGAMAPFSGNAARRGRIGIWSTLVGGTLATVWDGLVPDRTVRQASNLDDAALRDGKLIPNNSPVRFTVFVDRESIKSWFLKSPSQLKAEAGLLDARAASLRSQSAGLQEDERRKLSNEGLKLQADAAVLRAEAEVRDNKNTIRTKKNMLGRSRAKLEEDLVEARRGLGSIIIVGDQIEYKQRIQVDATAVTPQVNPSPQVRGVTGTAQTGASNSLVLLGSSLEKATVKALDCNPTFTTQGDPSGATITLKDFNVPASCKESAIRLVIDNGNGFPTVYSVPVTPQRSSPQTPGPAHE